MAHTECRIAFEANQSRDILGLTGCEKIEVGGVMDTGRSTCSLVVCILKA